jgi:ribosomal protein S27E
MRSRFTELVSRYTGICAECRRSIARNARMVYDWHAKKSYCKSCGDRLMQSTSLFK